MHIQRVYTQACNGNTGRNYGLLKSAVRRCAAIAGIAGLLIAGTPMPARAQQTASMTLNGPTSIALDATLSFEVRVKTSVKVNAVQADISFPTSLFTYEGISGDGSAFPTSLITSSANGNIMIVRAIFSGGSGDMLVSTVRLKGNKDGRGEIKILDSSMATDAETSENVVTVRQGLTVEVGTPSSDAPVEQGPTTNGVGQISDEVENGDPENPEATPTLDPNTGNEEVTNGNGSTLSGNNGSTRDITSNAGGLSAAAWSLIGVSVLLVAASIFFSVNLLKRRNRRMNAYQSYMQPPVNPMYNQGQMYDLKNIGYTARPYQTGTYQAGTYQQPAQQASQQPAQPTSAYGTQYPQYGTQYQQRQAYPQAPANPANQAYQPSPPANQPGQNNQSPW